MKSSEYFPLTLILSHQRLCRNSKSGFQTLFFVGVEPLKIKNNSLWGKYESLFFSTINCDTVSRGGNRKKNPGQTRRHAPTP